MRIQGRPWRPGPTAHCQYLISGPLNYLFHSTQDRAAKKALRTAESNRRSTVHCLSYALTRFQPVISGSSLTPDCKCHPFHDMVLGQTHENWQTFRRLLVCSCECVRVCVCEYVPGTPKTNQNHTCAANRAIWCEARSAGASHQWENC